MSGLTGKINFDSRGFRTDFDLDIVELKKEGLVKVNIGKKINNLSVYIFVAQNTNFDL